MLGTTSERAETVKNPDDLAVVMSWPQTQVSGKRLLEKNLSVVVATVGSSVVVKYF